MSASRLLVCTALAAAMGYTPRLTPEERPNEPQWSKSATALAWQGETRHLTIDSPDKRAAVVVGETRLQVFRGAKDLAGTENSGVSTLAELLWAPDSSAFVVTQSDGGWVGNWYVTVYAVGSDSVHKFNVMKPVSASFKKTYTCDDAENPNVGAVAWLGGSKELLVAAEVPPHSSCRGMGNVAGFVVDPKTGNVLAALTEGQLRKHFAEFLGTRFKK